MASNAREIFQPGGFVDAVVSYVEGPAKFYAQPLSVAKELRHMAKVMQVLYVTKILSETDNVITLDYLDKCMRQNLVCLCAAPFHIDQPPGATPIPTYYYRAAVMGRASPSTIKVFFVDYGNTSNVPIASLKTLPPSLLQQPYMAVPCRLIESENAALDGGAFRILVDGYHVVACVSQSHPYNADERLPYIAEPVWVSLFMTDGKEELNVAEEVLTATAAQPASANGN